VRALGGFLTIDVTPTLEAALAPQLARVARDIDRQLPDVKTEVEKAWPTLSTSRALPLLGCLVLDPNGIVQGPLSPSSERLRARFALMARPELWSACPAAAEPAALPPLQSDPSLPEEGVALLGLVTPLTAIAGALHSAPLLPGTDKGLRIAQATSSARGNDVALDLLLAGGVCGQVALRAEPDFSGDGRFIGLKQTRVSEADLDRIEQADLDASALAGAVQGVPKLSPLLSVSGFRESAPALASALSQRSVKISADVSATRAAGAAARGSELVAWLEARGSIALELTNLSL
jgi:hypothetical protein